jgi:hypothetical protein
MTQSNEQPQQPPITPTAAEVRAAIHRLLAAITDSTALRALHVVTRACLPPGHKERL